MRQVLLQAGDLLKKHYLLHHAYGSALPTQCNNYIDSLANRAFLVSDVV